MLDAARRAGRGDGHRDARAYAAWDEVGQRRRRRWRCETQSTLPTMRAAAWSRGCAHALVTPLEPEDLYTMSERIDAVINGAKNSVRDAQALEWTAGRGHGGHGRPPRRGNRPPRRRQCAASATTQPKPARGPTTPRIAARLVEKVYRAAIVVAATTSSMQTRSRSSRRSRRIETSWRSQTRSCTWRTGSGTRC